MLRRRRMRPAEDSVSVTESVASRCYGRPRGLGPGNVGPLEGTSNPAQTLDTSDFERPVSIPTAAARSSTERFDTPTRVSCTKNTPSSLRSIPRSHGGVDAVVFAGFFVYRIRTDWVVIASFIVFAVMVVGAETFYMRRFSDAEGTMNDHQETMS